MEVALPDGQRTIIRAGESLWFTRDAFSRLQPLNSSDASWTQGILSFRDRPLREVIATLSRYRPGVLRCDPAVAGLRLSGTFALGDSDAILHIIAQTLPVKLQFATRYWVTVVAA